MICDMQKIIEMGEGVLPHAVYSSNLSPSDDHFLFYSGPLTNWKHWISLQEFPESKAKHSSW